MPDSANSAVVVKMFRCARCLSLHHVCFEISTTQGGKNHILEKLDLFLTRDTGAFKTCVFFWFCLLDNIAHIRPPSSNEYRDDLPELHQANLHINETTLGQPRFEMGVHPGRLTWNLQITNLERKMIFQTSMRTCSMLIFRGVVVFFRSETYPFSHNQGSVESCHLRRYPMFPLNRDCGKKIDQKQPKITELPLRSLTDCLDPLVSTKKAPAVMWSVGQDGVSFSSK